LHVHGVKVGLRVGTSLDSSIGPGGACALAVVGPVIHASTDTMATTATRRVIVRFMGFPSGAVRNGRKVYLETDLTSRLG
jgi:hypothetical protein